MFRRISVGDCAEKLIPCVLNGCGALRPSFRNHLQRKLGNDSMVDSLISRVDSQYAMFMEAITPCQMQWSSGNYVVVMAHKLTTDPDAYQRWLQRLGSRTAVDSVRGSHIIFLVQRFSDMFVELEAEECAVDTASREGLILTGRHELEHGAYFDTASDRHPPTVFLTKCLKALFDWLELDDSRRVTFMSCDPDCPYNFEWKRGKSCIAHASLLETRMPTHEDHESHPVLSKLQQLGPEFCTLRCLDASSARSALFGSESARDDPHFSHNIHVEGTMVNYPVVQPPPQKRTSNMYVAQVTSTSVEIHVESECKGYLTCSVYKAPRYSTSMDAFYLIKEHKDQLSIISTSSKIIRSENGCIFQFYGLNPDSCYIAELRSSIEAPSLLCVHFHTHISSFNSYFRALIIPSIMNNNSLHIPCSVKKYSDRYRPFVVPWFVLNGSTERFDALPTSLMPLSKHSLHFHSCEGKSRGLHFVRWGSVMLISPKNEDMEGLLDICSFIEDFAVDAANFDLLIILLAKPLVIYKFSQDSKTSTDGFVAFYPELCERLVSNLIKWKEGSTSRRECLLLSLNCLEQIKCFKFSTLHCATSVLSVALPKLHGTTNHSQFFHESIKIHKCAFYEACPLPNSITFLVPERPSIEPKFLHYNLDVRRNLYIQSPGTYEIALQGLYAQAEDAEIIGPVIGKITCSSAVITCEFSEDLDEVKCVLESTFSGLQFTSIATNLKSFTVVFFEFDSLPSSENFCVRIQPLGGNLILGQFRTLDAQPTVLKHCYLGDGATKDCPILEYIINNVWSMVPVEERNFDMQRTIRSIRNCFKLDDAYLSNLWRHLINLIRSPISHINNMTFVGAFSILSDYSEEIVPTLNEQAHRASRATGILSELYSLQLKDAMQDAFRIPFLARGPRQAFSMCSSTFLHSTTYNGILGESPPAILHLNFAANYAKYMNRVNGDEAPAHMDIERMDGVTKVYLHLYDKDAITEAHLTEVANILQVLTVSLHLIFR